MTPEELNRTIDFIIQSQARLVAAQEQDREFQGLMVRLVEHQSRRIDWNEKAQDEFRQEMKEQRREMQQQHNDAMAKLDRILDKLSDRRN